MTNVQVVFASVSIFVAIVTAQSSTVNTTESESLIASNNSAYISCHDGSTSLFLTENSNGNESDVILSGHWHQIFTTFEEADDVYFWAFQPDNLATINYTEVQCGEALRQSWFGLGTYMTSAYPSSPAYSFSLDDRYAFQLGDGKFYAGLVHLEEVEPQERNFTLNFGASGEFDMADVQSFFQFLINSTDSD